MLREGQNCFNTLIECRTLSHSLISHSFIGSIWLNTPDIGKNTELDFEGIKRVYILLLLSLPIQGKLQKLVYKTQQYLFVIFKRSSIRKLLTILLIAIYLNKKFTISSIKVFIYKYFFNICNLDHNEKFSNFHEIETF